MKFLLLLLVIILIVLAGCKKDITGVSSEEELIEAINNGQAKIKIKGLSIGGSTNLSRCSADDAIVADES